MAQDTVTNLAEVIAEVNALDDKIENMETLDTLEEIEANTETGVIAGALAVKELNSSLTNNGEKFQFGYDAENDVYGYIKAGADTVTPFKSLEFLEVSSGYEDNAGTTLTIPEDGDYSLITNHAYYYTGNYEYGCSLNSQDGILTQKSILTLPEVNTIRIDTRLYTAINLKEGDTITITNIYHSGYSHYDIMWILSKI